MNNPTNSADEAQGSLVQGLDPDGPRGLLAQVEAVAAEAADLTGAASIPGLYNLQQLMRSPRSSERQQKIIAVLKSNPHIMAAVIKERQAKIAARGVSSGVVGSGHLQFQQQQQLNSLHLLQRMLEHGGAADSDTAAIAGLHRQALQQLLHVLQSPKSPEQQQEVIAILKANPLLMGAYIKKRQAQIAAQSGATGVTVPPLQYMLNQQQQQGGLEIDQMQAMIEDLSLEDLDQVNP